ncbi:MAG TPA: response regulator [Armatimonadota bacterium]|jgi:DNA-binding response OmpR family regulator
MANILVIDDEPNIRTMVRMALEQRGDRVEEADDGLDGLEQYGDGAGWDVVLLDQRMPGIEGLDVLRQMKRLAPRANVVMMTAFGTLDLAVDAMAAGATDFLRKPFSLEMLRGAVEAAQRHHAVATPEPGENRLVFTTFNGYRIEPLREPAKRRSGEIQQTAAVRAPNGNLTPCVVVFPPDLVEQIHRKVGDSDWPVMDRFWQGLAEEMLAHYVWHNASVPIGAFLRRGDYGPYLDHWLNAVSGDRQAA